MQTSENGLKFIATNEGFTATPKGDFGHQVIGYGHDILPGESFPKPITPAQGWTEMCSDVAKVDAAMNAQRLALDLNQNQWDAVADWAYNVGIGNLATLLAHGIDQIPIQLPRWNLAQGKVLPDLVTRRAEEVALFNS